MKELKLLHEELAIMRMWQGEYKRMELYTVTTGIAVIEKALEAAQEKIAEEHAEEKFWAQKAAQANYKDAEANIAETVYGARVGWYRNEVAKMEAELKKLRRKVKRTQRVIDELDAFTEKFGGALKVNTDDNTDTNANVEKETTNTVNGAYCFECGQWIEDANDMNSGMFAQPSHEHGTPNIEGFANSACCYSEFVCTDCLEKHYHQCAKCAEFYHESRCTQDEQGNWICDNCRKQHAE